MRRYNFILVLLLLFSFLPLLSASEGDYISSFSVPDVTNLQDITFGEGYFWLYDGDCWDGCGIYQYTFSDKKYTGFYSDLSSTENWEIQGIDYDGSYFRTVDSEDNLIYEYFYNWTPTGYNTYVEGISSPMGITSEEDYFWVSSGQTFPSEIWYIYKYWINGTYTGEKFITSTYSPGLKDIVKVGNYIWVLGSTAVYKYELDGSYTGFSFDISGYGITTPTGITSSEGSLWISDSTNRRVYEFELNVETSSEICDGIDNDGDDLIDEDLAFFTYYLDSDKDGEGDLNYSVSNCSQPSGYLNNYYDCDDSNSAINTKASEICNEIDDNCNGEVDEGVKILFFIDSDEDGFGVPEESYLACTVPEGFSVYDNDCNDTNSEINPGAEEICDNIDNDCSGFVDEDLTRPYGTTDIGECQYGVEECSFGSWYITVPSTGPSDEVCDGLDNNCDGEVDENVMTMFYPDFDDDGFGDILIVTQACSAPERYVESSGDCNDGDFNINPGMEEICDGIDNNCDGFIDEDFLDTDNDGMADCVDWDDDNDNVLDEYDLCQTVSSRGYDIDLNGCMDNLYDFYNIILNLPGEVISQDYRVVLLADVSNSIKSFEKEKYLNVIRDMNSLADSVMEQKIRKIDPETANMLSNYAKNIAATLPFAF